MLFKRLLIILLLLFASTLHGFGKSYETWELLYGDKNAKISKVYDRELKRKVTQFQSQSSRDTYINGAKRGAKAWNNTQDKILQWQFNFDQSYVIIISVMTLDGHRNIIYTSGDEDGELYFGLGEDTIAGEWQTITRNLEHDLRRYEPRNSIISVNAFLLRGSGKIAKVELLNALPGQEATAQLKPKKTTPKSLPVEPTSKKISETKRSKLPTITLKKGELIYHRLGEPFYDPGAVAYDMDKNPLEVDMLGEVNINRVNKYTLTYIATDKKGNTATKSRVVMVYRPGESEAPMRTTGKTKESKPLIKEESNNSLSKKANNPPQVLDDPDLDKENQKQEEMLEYIDD